MSEFSESLTGWYKKNKRNLPWRKTKDPYKIWLSEIILQQTQVAQGLSYYSNFIAKYPEIKHLAAAPINEVMKLWQGLGYYSRARNLHETAKYIVNNYKGIFPKTYGEIIALKGVGNYTAAAIASFAYDLPYAVVDGNVYRVLSRIFDISAAIDSAEGKKQFQNLANELLDKKQPAIHNQAIMEFGALHCRPVNPDCDTCVLKLKCFAFSKKTVFKRPVKSKKTKITHRYLYYFVFTNKNHVYLRKRNKKDIWQGLYEFFLIEKNMKTDLNELLKDKELKNIIGKAALSLKRVSHEYKHILSHQKLHAVFLNIEIPSFSIKEDELKKIHFNSFAKYPLPRLIEKYVNDYGLFI